MAYSISFPPPLTNTPYHHHLIAILIRLSTRLSFDATRMMVCVVPRGPSAPAVDLAIVGPLTPLRHAPLVDTLKAGALHQLGVLPAFKVSVDCVYFGGITAHVAAYVAFERRLEEGALGFKELCPSLHASLLELRGRLGQLLRSPVESERLLREVLVRLVRIEGFLVRGVGVAKAKAVAHVSLFSPC